MRPGELLADRFEIEELARSGGMAEVYRALDRHTGDVVALKVLSGRVHDAERFMREARVLAELHHPRIVRYVAHGEAPGGQIYLAMEWLSGEDLADRLARAPLTTLESVELVARVAEALAVAHARGIVHRDIKPGNLFLPKGDIGGVKILDFGIAWLGQTSRVHTHTGWFVGTPGYMAPEQARGERDLDARVDVFALGCVLFECLTGRRAFAGDHGMAVLAKVLLDDAPRPSDLREQVDEDLDRLVARMLAKDRVLRPADGAQVAAALDAMRGPLSSLRGRPPIGSSRFRALTTGEQRLVSVVLAEAALTPDPSAPTLASAPNLEEAAARQAASPKQGAPSWEEFRATVGLFGGRIEMLAGGSLVVELAGSGHATDRAAHAARCALLLRRDLPGARMALATGRGVLSGRQPYGEVIDRAVTLLESVPPEGRPEDPGKLPVRIDDVTAGLLDLRFDVAADDAGFALVGEREVVEQTRTLLGKPTPCVGRDRELAALLGFYEECVSEPVARAVVVVGPAGVGKSRVRHELLRRIRQEGHAVEILMARGDPMRKGSPFGMIAPAIRRAAGILEGEPLVARRRKLRARVARHVREEHRARVTEFLGELVGADFSDVGSPELRSARSDPVLMGEQMRRAWEAFLEAEASVQPVVVVLEDLHWGDLPSVKFIDAALRTLAERPLMVLAFARPEVHELFPGLWAARGAHEVRLGELTRKSSEKLVRAVLGDGASDDLVHSLALRSEGNPFYLEELIRAVALGSGGALPETVLVSVQARLERLEPDARQVLRAASVFGDTFWTGGLTALLGGAKKAARLVEWLAQLVDAEVVLRRGQGKFPGEQEYQFRHPLVREAAYATLTDADRVLGHRLAGGWLEAAGEEDAMLLGEHFERGSEPARAVGCYVRAAEQALEGGDLGAAVARAERGIACGATGEALTRLTGLLERARSL
jgi:eukaryotic-like serine/threonine-protein kinase